MLFGWFGTVIKESRGGLFSAQMDRSFRWGMSWFIFSEVMFFIAFFGALFYVRHISGPALGGEGAQGITHMLWPNFQFTWPLLSNPDSKLLPPPKEVISPWGLPLLNTVLLVSSSVTVTIAHHALKKGHRGALKLWLALTVLLGSAFLIFQAEEYMHAYRELGLTLGSGIYGATFFMLTGFHGAHVTIAISTTSTSSVSKRRPGTGTSWMWCGSGCLFSSMCFKAAVTRGHWKPAGR
jgi:cytochrome c oxidase subunit 3